MKKRLILIISITIGILSVITAIGIELYNNHKKANNDAVLKDNALLEKLISDESRESSEKLKELTARKDAIGYYANLTLADRFAGDGEEDAYSYYKKALELYDTKSVRKRCALYLIKQENLSEAITISTPNVFDTEIIEGMKTLSIEPVKLATILIDNGQWKTAENFLESEFKKNLDAAARISLEEFYVEALGERGEYKELKPLVEKLMKSDPNDKNMKYWYARCIESTDLKKAKELYAASGAIGANQLGFLLDKEGKYKEAAEAYSKGTDTDSIWKAAKLYDETGNTDSALQGYLQLVKGDTSYSDDAAYRAYLILSSRNSPGAQEMLDKISGYPAWMSRLGKQPVFEELPDATYTKPEFLSNVESYRNAGKDNMAQVELSIGEKYADFDAMLALGDWYQAQDDYYEASGWGMKALQEKKVKHAYELAYPRRFEDIVEKYSKEFNLDPNLLYGLIRQESGFNETVASGVGAQGLTQLMPATAEDIAKKLKVAVKEEDLLNPDINIRFGAYYLHSLLDSFSGDMDKALAAYNGGGGNVRKWSKTKLGSSKGGFPTSVNFYETREYITKVMNSYYTYKWLCKDN